MANSPQQCQATDAQLATALAALGVRFIRTGPSQAATASLPPAQLLAGLAASAEARLRLALIPLLLQYPAFGALAPAVAAELPPSTVLSFQCYYTAAHLLQLIEPAACPTPALSDYFSAQLGAPAVGSPHQRLAALAARHVLLSGEAINWLGTYQHAVRFLGRAEVAYT